MINLNNGKKRKKIISIDKFQLKEKRIIFAVHFMKINLKTLDMKRIKFFALALLFSSFCLVACNDDDPKDPNNNGDDPEQPGGPGDPSDPNYVDLSTIDFMKYAWWITSVECPDIPAEAMERIQQGIKEHSLQFDNFGMSGGVDYANWGMNLSIHVQSQFAFFVKYYKVKDQTLCFTAGSTMYKGKIKYTQDDIKIYATFTGDVTNAKGSKQTKFACYIYKGK